MPEIEDINSSSPITEERLIWVPLTKLFSHPLNPNIMSASKLAKLTRNIVREEDYPPLIVRPHPAQACAYQILDGHQRRVVLERLGKKRALCFVWPCDDKTALVLLSTLNRLHGEDVPARRAQLLRELTALLPGEELSKLLPDAAAKIQDMLNAFSMDSPGLLQQLTRATGSAGQAMSLPLTFTLAPEDRAVLENALQRASRDLNGHNRRGRALGIIARTYLESEGRSQT